MKQLVYLVNALDVLEEVARHGSGITLTHIAANVGLSKSGVFRILATLEPRGYVRRVGDRYRTGHRVYDLTAGVSQRNLLSLARPIMETVTADLNESTFLSVLVGFETMTLETVEPQQTVRVHMPAGAGAPANCTVSGLALLAQLGSEQLEAVMPERLQATSPESITDKARFRMELERIRRRGYAMFVGIWKPDAGGGAAAILDERGRPVAAFGVAAPTSRLSEERLLELGQSARKAAAAISAALGYVQPMAVAEPITPTLLANQPCLE